MKPKTRTRAKKRIPRDYRAKLVIHDADAMTEELRSGLAAWLRRLARDVAKGREPYARRFTARYMIVE